MQAEGVTRLRIGDRAGAGQRNPDSAHVVADVGGNTIAVEELQGKIRDIIGYRLRCPADDQFNGMVADVQQWLDNPSGNFGWILVGNETAPHLTKRFDSREDTVLTSRPKLTIVYSPSASVRPENPGPSSFTLLQNYPNPFNPSTVIRFTVPDGISSPTVLRVYDLMGKEVATLVNEVMTPGSHEVTFSTRVGSASGENGTTLASGIYYYQLRSGEFLETRRMVLVR